MKLTNQIKRLTLIAEFVRMHPYATKQQILDHLNTRMQSQIIDADAERTGISERNLDRDIKALRDNGFGIEWSTSQRGYYIGYETSDAEAFMRMLEAFHISQASSYGKNLQLEQVGMKGYEFLHGMMHAIQNNKVVVFDYQKFQNDNVKKRKLEPYLIKEFKRRLYVLGKDRDDENRVKTFAFDRIKSLDILPDSFTVTENFNDYFNDCYGIVNDAEVGVEYIKLKARKTKAKYLQSLPLHHTQRIAERQATHIIFELYLKPTYDFEMEVLSHGEELEVLQPEWFRKKIARVLSNATNCYIR